MTIEPTVLLLVFAVAAMVCSACVNQQFFDRFERACFRFAGWLNLAAFGVTALALLWIEVTA